MKKVSKKAIRDYIRLGLAIDITNASPDAITARNSNLFRVF